MSNLHISIVSPVFNAEKLLDQLTTELVKHVGRITQSYEIILVDDGSTDMSWEGIKRICRLNGKIKGIKLSRNFGQHKAITSGLQEAKGEWIIVMDCDLQDRPDQIAKLYREATSENDIIFARRLNRTDKWWRRISSYLFYKFFGFLTNSKQDSSIANFGMYKRKTIVALLSMKDHIRYFPTMIQWVGFNKTYVDVEQGERDGRSSYSWSKLFNLAFDNIISYSDKPLRIVIVFGFVISFISSLVGIYFMTQYLRDKITVSGFTSLIISVWFLSGTIILILGVVGIYVGKAFDKVKDRPLYIIDAKINCSKE